jgi:hypothetical protein
MVDLENMQVNHLKSDVAHAPETSGLIDHEQQ